MLPSDSFMSRLHSLLEHYTGEFQALPHNMILYFSLSYFHISDSALFFYIYISTLILYRCGVRTFYWSLCCPLIYISFDVILLNLCSYVSCILVCTCTVFNILRQRRGSICNIVSRKVNKIRNLPRAVKSTTLRKTFSEHILLDGIPQ